MNIELKDLLSLISEAVDAGVQKYVQSIDPHADMIKQSEAKRYISRLGYKPVMLQRWADAHLLTPIKTGDAQNASVLYSLSEIKSVISSLRLHGITLKAAHDYN
jgi:hypothetical protein